MITRVYYEIEADCRPVFYGSSLRREDCLYWGPLGWTLSLAPFSTQIDLPFTTCPDVEGAVSLVEAIHDAAARHDQQHGNTWVLRFILSRTRHGVRLSAVLHATYLFIPPAAQLPPPWFVSTLWATGISPDHFPQRPRVVAPPPPPPPSPTTAYDRLLDED